jgi:rare lipoprotein A
MNTFLQLLAALVATTALGGVAVAIAADPAPAPTAAAPTAPAPTIAAPAAATPKVTTSTAETGLAAVYSDKLQGRKTASGERYDRSRLTAAHKTLPFGTQLKVTNVKNNKTIVVRINDRGPVQAGRILDLSPTAARAIGIGRLGMGEVSTEVVGEAPKSNKR